MRRDLKKRIFFLFFVLGGIIFAGYSILGIEARRKDLNLLLITIDTIRPDRISCYNTKYLKTPQIDALAEKGVVFTRAFAHNPITLPSHANILLGATPIYHGVHENSKSRVSKDLLSLAEYLKTKGYSCGAFVGAFPLDSRFGLNQGFDVYDDSYPSKPSYEFVYAERKAEEVIKTALVWLERQNSKWFCWVHLWDPHAPYLPPEPFKSKFTDDPYSGEVAYVDSELGKIFDYLESSKQMENTLILLTGDHGESLGDHGELTHNYFAYNSSIWVPLIIEGPEINPGRIDDYVCHIDLFPTLCDILGIEKPAFLQGVSLLPLIKGKKIKKRAIYFESLDAYYNRGWAPLRGYIEEGKKYIDSPIPEVYDLEQDFNEKRNLASNVNLGEYRKNLKKMEKEFSSSDRVRSVQKIDREVMEKLRSLGYLVSPVTQLKENYGPEDDLKTLLPFHDKMDRAILLDGEGKKGQSVKLLNEIIQEKKDFSEAYTYLSYIYRSQGQMEEALKVMEDGYNNNPKNYAILSGYGILLVREEKLDEAVEVLQKALALYDLDPEVWNYLGVAYWRKGDYQKALEHYQKAVSLDDTQAIIFSNLGALYLSIFLQTKKAKDHTQSIEYFKKAIELDPRLSMAYKGLGVANRLVEKVDDAISCWEKALELSPNDDFIVYNLGIAYLERGMKSQALEYFKRYLSLKKNSLSPEEGKKIDALIQKCKEES